MFPSMKLYLSGKDGCTTLSSNCLLEFYIPLFITNKEESASSTFMLSSFSLHLPLFQENLLYLFVDRLIICKGD